MGSNTCLAMMYNIKSLENYAPPPTQALCCLERTMNINHKICITFCLCFLFKFCFCWKGVGYPWNKIHVDNFTVLLRYISFKEIGVKVYPDSHQNRKWKRLLQLNGAVQISITTTKTLVGFSSCIYFKDITKHAKIKIPKHGSRQL